MNKDLKHCPRCGNYNLKVETGTYEMMKMSAPTIIMCKCGIRMKGFGDRDKIFNHWNTRPNEDHLKKEIEKLRSKFANVQAILAMAETTIAVRDLELVLKDWNPTK